MLILIKLGAIAQLGERLHGMQEVVGSNPIGSISYLFFLSHYILKVLVLVDVNIRESR